METQAVAAVNPMYMTDLTARISYYKMRENFTFMPKYHVTDLYEQHVGDLHTFTKKLLDSDWGNWSPRGETIPLIQVTITRHLDCDTICVVLTRDFNARRNIFVYRESHQGDGYRVIEACVSLYMSDVDDDGNFTSEIMGSELLENIEFIN